MLLRLSLALLFLIKTYLGSLFLWHWTPRDRNGNRPRDVAKAFIEAVKSNDFAGATRFWEPGATRRVEANFQMSFENFCTETFKCDVYRLGFTTRQKEGLRMVPFRGKLDGHTKAYSLYFRKVDGAWKIGEELWLPHDSAPWQNPATSNWFPNL